MKKKCKNCQDSYEYIFPSSGKYFCSKVCSYLYKTKSKVGVKFGDLTIEKIIRKNNSRYCQCVCSCGKRITVYGSSLTRRGGMTSCGCKTYFTNEEATINQILAMYKANAKRKNRVFNLSKQLFTKLISSNCEYCGTKPKQIKNTYKGKGLVPYNGIDRIDSSKGYTKDNCLSCCFRCNTAKSDMTTDDFVKWIKQVYNYLYLYVEEK